MTAREVDRLVLGSHLSEMDRLSAWVEELGTRYAIGEEKKFAIQLCLEEAVSNVIRHGYANAPGLEVTVTATAPKDGRGFVFTVEDNAAGFNPLEGELGPLIGQDPDRIGGQGIRLMRGFADSLEYEATRTGNRLRIGFAKEVS